MIGSVKKVTARNADYDEHNCRYLVGEEVLLGVIMNIINDY